MNNKKKKFFSIMELIVGGIFILGLIITIVIELALPTSAATSFLKANILDITQLQTWFKTDIQKIISTIITILMVYFISKIIRYILHIRMTKSNRAKTLSSLIEGFVKYAAALIILFIILKACGVNTQTLIASVGVLSLIVGLGAQPLIADIIAGIFIFFDDEYDVGEIVSIDGFRGTVTEIGLRSTKVQDASGNIKIINNNDINNIVNMSRELSLAVVDCEFPYDIPIEYLEKLLKDNFDQWKENIDGIIEGPYYKGVTMYAASNVVIKIIAKCKEEDRFQIQRDLLRAYREMITKEGIDISYDQVVINTASVEPNKQVSKKEKQKVEAFVEEQKNQSSGLEDQKIE